MAGDVLYNGIVLPECWPPADIAEVPDDPIPVPYLKDAPAVIHIDLGRQLFVDDFLIESTTLTRRFGKPEVHPASPVLCPETTEEMDNGNCPMAAPFNGGLWYDSADGLFKLWYMPGWFHTVALATSTDGIHWQRPELDVVPGTNLVWPPRKGYERDGCLVWLDHDPADPAERFKMFQFYRFDEPLASAGWLHTSPDGVHWSAPAVTTPIGDNSSFFHNPFRRKWCMSIRRSSSAAGGLRARWYHERDEFLNPAQWDRGTQEVFWQRVDHLDPGDPARPDHRTALYDLNVTPYESIMLGLFAIFHGPENHICAELGVPKTIDLHLGYSRDGFHFSRPDRTPFLAATRREGDWNRAYLHAVGGGCVVVGDELLLPFTAFSGISPRLGRTDVGSPGRGRRVMYAGASTGLATLRRDGFAPMTAGPDGGRLLTTPLAFSGRRLFVNVRNPKGGLVVEALCDDGNVIDGLSSADCVPVATDSTCCEVTWRGGKSLSAVGDKPVRLRFRLERGEFFAFWVTDDPGGASHGYVAAGGPGFTNGRDLP